MMVNALTRVLDGYDQKEILRFVRQSFDLRLKNDLDVLLYPRINKNNFRSFVSVEGLEYLDNALKNGKGVILLHSHFGNPQILMVALGYMDYPLHQIAGNPTEDMEDLLKRPLTTLESKVSELRLVHEKTLPVNFIYAFKSMRPVFRCLKDNEILAIAIDGGKDKSRVYVQFLNHTAFFSSGPMKIALKTQAGVLPLFVIRKSNYGHKVIIGQPLELSFTDDIEHDIKENTQKFISILERYVMEYPSHYVIPLIGEHRDRFAGKSFVENNTEKIQ